MGFGIVSLADQLTVLMLRRDRLTSMMVWRSAVMMAAGEKRSMIVVERRRWRRKSCG